MITLHIDTREINKVVARIDNNGEQFEEVSTTETKRPESILVLIDTLLTKTKIDKSQIDEIKVEEGPGSYTGLKVGISVANALSFSLNKPVNGKKYGELVEPTYQ